jgi:hypothetical protein
MIDERVETRAAAKTATSSVIAAEKDHAVNLKAELEILSLHQKIDALREQQWGRPGSGLRLFEIGGNENSHARHAAPRQFRKIVDPTPFQKTIDLWRSLFAIAMGLSKVRLARLADSCWNDLNETCLTIST